jgi:hypothetical protein
MRSQRDFLISHLHRGLHRGQRSMTAQKGRTYDRTAPSGETSEKALASGAVPHMTLRHSSSAGAAAREHQSNSKLKSIVGTIRMFMAATLAA